MKLNGAQLVCRLLERQGIPTISGIPGGANLPLYDALYESPIRHILARHEQGAGFIAHGMARVSGRAAVCLGTSGPGATNLLTAIADAKLDSVPLVAITGQVPTALMGTDAFQEVDTYSLTLPITKHNFLVTEVEELLSVIPRAFEIAESGRPGPVVIDIPKDILQRELEVASWPEPGGRLAPEPCTPTALRPLAELIARAERPVLYIGGGVAAAGCGAAVRELARRMDAPIAATLMALGEVPSEEPRFLGMLGMHAAPSTNFILDEADLLIAIGARFDDRATGKAVEFCKHATIAHIDIDPSELGKIKPTNFTLAADAAQALRALLPQVPMQSRPAWCARVETLRAEYPLPAPEPGAFHPLEFCRWLGALLPRDVIVTTDVGQHQMWMAQGYPFCTPRSWLTSGGLGTMGFGLPAAIGAALEAPERTVVCVSGDGSILMNIQELATLAELGLNVKTIILNNAQYGLVRQQQALFYGGRFSASRYATPDFAAAARAFGVEGVDLPAQMGTTERLMALAHALETPGPCVINFALPSEQDVLPMVPPGGANREMVGYARRASPSAAAPMTPASLPSAAGTI